MKLVLLRTCVVECEGHESVTLHPGDTVEIPEQFAIGAIARGLAHEFMTVDDLKSGAPGREKAALRKAHEYN